MKRWLPLLAVMAAQPLQAQANQPSFANDPVMVSVRELFRPIRRYILEAAEKMPESEYGFQPTTEVRTFGQLVGHLANTQYNFCSAALGERRQSTENYEQRTTKQALVEALKTSLEYCDRAYAEIGDAKAAELVSMFGTQRPRIYALTYNVAHNNEHYGNMVTYLRMKGIVPPSSAR